MIHRKSIAQGFDQDSIKYDETCVVFNISLIPFVLCFGAVFFLRFRLAHIKSTLFMLSSDDSQQTIHMNVLYNTRSSSETTRLLSYLLP